MKVNASITDYPIFSPLETFFKKFKDAGVDGLELVLGVKSRFEYSRLAYLSEKYNLPINSIHQPPWSGTGVYFDESFVVFAKKLGIRNIVFHPLAFRSFESRAMKHYFEALAHLQEKYDICVMLENMPRDFAYKKLHDNTPQNIDHHLEKMNSIADQYGFLLTYDVSHAEIVNPEKNDIFKSIFPKIGNIHASSFIKGKHHLPFTMGDFKIKDFINYLQKEKYQGLFTLEVYYPKLLLIRNRYNFKAISDSVKIIKEIIYK